MVYAKRLLVVDDDDDLRGLLGEQFAAEADLTVETASNLAQAAEKIGAFDPDIIILDVNLPDGDGRAFCKSIRDDGVVVPVVMLTASTEEGVEVGGLDSGANDHVAKPFKFDALLARVRAHLRTHDQSEHATFPVGPYRFRPSAKLLTAEDGRRIRLTEKETNILRFLKRADGEAVPREKLLHEVWGYNPNVTTHTLETHVYRLRQKIEPDPKAASIILTADGGYRLGAATA